VHTTNYKIKTSRMHIVECTSAQYETQVLYAMWGWVLGVLSLLEVETIVTCNKLQSSGG
jgi:hypothetical protein